MLDRSSETVEQARGALEAYPHALNVGGGVSRRNAMQWLDEYAAGKVIVTSSLFRQPIQGGGNGGDGYGEGEAVFEWDELRRVSELVGRSRLVVDLSCRRKSNSETFDSAEEEDEDVEEDSQSCSSGHKWQVMINKWQTPSSLYITPRTLSRISQFASSFLVHSADVEGTCGGIDQELVGKLGQWIPDDCGGNGGGGCECVYAGGGKNVTDLELVERLSGGKVDLVFGSALDLFGGSLVEFDDCLNWNREHTNSNKLE